MNTQEFAARIRSKYPGAYDQLPDEDLARRVVAKFPQYSQHVTFDAPKFQNPLRSAATQAVAAIQPQVGPSNEGLISSAGNAVKEMFMPTIDTARRALNPNVGQVGVLRPIEQAGQNVGAAVRAAAQNIMDRAATSQFGQKHTTPVAAGGAVLGTLTDLASTGLTPTAFQQELGREGMGIAKNIITRPSAVGAARRALGYRKSNLNSTASPTEALRKQVMANQAAGELLDRGAISQTGNVESTAGMVQKVGEKAKQKFNEILAPINKGLKSADVSQRIAKEINPTFEDQKGFVDALQHDLQSMGDQIPLTQAKRVLKERWGRIGYQLKGVNTDASRIYRRASQILESEISNKVKEEAGGSVARAYKAANKSFGASKGSMRALTGELAANMGNNAISPVSTIVAGQQIAAGNPAGALKALGLLEAVKRRGAGVAANVLGGPLTPGIRSGEIMALQGALNRRRKSK